MKNVFNTPKKVILMVAMLATVIGYANNDKLKFHRDAKITAVTLNVKEGNLLTIKDVNGIILYKEIMKQEGLYSKGFDLSALPNGNYVIELEKDIEIKFMPFTVLESEVLFNENEETSFFKPVTRLKDNLIYVSKLALNNEDLKVAIYSKNTEGAANNDYELVFEENISNDNKLERVYKLSKKGNYKIVYLTEGRTFTEYINN